MVSSVLVTIMTFSFISAQEHIYYPICDLLTQEDINGDPQIYGGVPNVLFIYNDTDAESLDIGCVLRAAVPSVAVVEIAQKPCMQLLTIDALPEEIHILVTRGRFTMQFCDAQVYGAIPSVIEVRITTSTNRGNAKFLTFNMIANGGFLNGSTQHQIEQILIATNRNFE
ncbi:hypothetical protein RB195_021014 [Necator americanus]|uniref:Uncharacterized protein n=1 Tax=Necator americanus TaxID=51031 RepID=A0ABR1CLT9_NECAM